MKRVRVSSISAVTAAAALLVPVLLMFSGQAAAADVDSGSKIYQRYCADCHGANGRGDFPGMPDFSRGEGLFQPNSALLNTLRIGKSVMPGFDGLLTDDEMRDVIAYLRTLR